MDPRNAAIYVRGRLLDNDDATLAGALRLGFCCSSFPRVGSGRLVWMKRNAHAGHSSVLHALGQTVEQLCTLGPCQLQGWQAVRCHKVLKPGG